jgi:GDP-4-dehydro-6-deoxy-D-mannose reductase
LRILVTGAGGFVGKHLLTHLRQQPDNELFGTLSTIEERRADLVAICPELPVLDLRDEAAVMALISEIQPDQIYHLAGQAFVPRSFENPWETLDTNIHTTLNLFQAIVKLKLSTRVLVIGSAEVYGAVDVARLPINEETPFFPSSPYSVSKIAQDMLALQYKLTYGLFTVRVRPFNHIGPGQSPRFAVPSWASQIAEIEAGLREPIVYVGDLSAARDFTDVRDVVRAYETALNSGTAGAVYNVCSGVSHTMQAIVDTLLKLSSAPIELRIDRERLRPVEIPILTGDFSRLNKDTGWQPQISIEQSLRDVLDEWRQRVHTQLPNTH